MEQLKFDPSISGLASSFGVSEAKVEELTNKLQAAWGKEHNRESEQFKLSNVIKDMLPLIKTPEEAFVTGVVIGTQYERYGKLMESYG